DPLHYAAPEGSYAATGHQRGGQRVAAFRSMVGGLHDIGMQVVLDQVYNHTSFSGQDSPSVLDRIVPGYYHRLDKAGNVTTSSCCQNMATEHRMAQKLMVDSVVTWAADYHVDGFRFDLMGHHSVGNMTAVREALDELTLAEDGVDGESVYLYGEGWDFGEVTGNARFTQAIQGQLAVPVSVRFPTGYAMRCVAARRSMMIPEPCRASAAGPSPIPMLRPRVRPRSRLRDWGTRAIWCVWGWPGI